MARVVNISGKVATTAKDHMPTLPFLKQVLGEFRVHALSRERLPSIFASADGENAGLLVLPNSLLMGTMHHCFTQHIPLSLSPDVLWYVIVNEVADHVRLHPEEYRHLFTRSDKKEKITVRDDSLVYGSADNDWSGAIRLFLAPLKEKIGNQAVNLFVAPFSTSTIESHTAALIAFMDVVSCYYSYELMTLCGIPRVRLEGDAEDWTDLANRTRELEKSFTLLGRYFWNLVPVLDKLAAAAQGENDKTFWKSIFKIQGGSGGPYINGWITAFHAHQHEAGKCRPKHESLYDWAEKREFGGFTQQQFPAHVSKVDFLWKYLDREMPMWLVSGVLGVEWEDGFLRPRLGYAVAEPPGGAEGEVRRTIAEEVPGLAEALDPPPKAWWKFWRK